MPLDNPGRPARYVFVFEAGSALEGKTIVAGGLQFVDGKAAVVLLPDQVPAFKNLMSMWRASLEGEQSELKLETTPDTASTPSPSPEVQPTLPSAPVEEEDTELTLAEVIQSLNPDTDDHWTKLNIPSMEAVEKAFGKNVTRAEVEAAAPGFNRDAARALRASADPLA